VTNRDGDLFQPAYLSLSQLDDLIAIVNVSGKEQFFDPGQRYCPYGHLAWKHTMAGGLRQTDGATSLGNTPSEPYTASRIQRVADLTMDEHGDVSGPVHVAWVGAPALRWRQLKLRGDITGLQQDLRSYMERILPGGAEVNITGIENLEDYEKPLIVNYAIKTAIASSAGKRMLVPGDIFTMNSKPSFPHATRDLPVYFEYPRMVQDAMRLKLPASLGIESLPATAKEQFQKFAAYSIDSTAAADSFTIHRTFALGEVIFATAEYPDLRSFYGKMETKDQEPVVLKAAASAPSGN